MQSIPTRTVDFDHMGFHDEKHGDETVQAIALKFSFDAQNSLLDQFAPGLRKALYRAAEAGDAQELFDDAEHMPHLRFPKLPAFRWDEEMIGRKVTIRYGIDEDGAIEFDEATVDKFAFDLKEGGLITVTFRVKARPSAEQVAKLFTLKGHEVDITVEPPRIAQGELEEPGDDDDESARTGEQVWADAMDGTGDDLGEAD